MEPFPVRTPACSTSSKQVAEEEGEAHDDDAWVQIDDVPASPANNGPDAKDEEDLEENGGITIKNASQYLAYKPKAKLPPGDLRQTSGWFDAYAHRGPNQPRWDALWAFRKK